MKLVRYDRKLLGDEIGYRKTKYQRLLEEFDASDMDVAVVKDWTTKNAYAYTRGLKSAIDRFGYSGKIIVLTKNGDVILIKTKVLKG